MYARDNAAVATDMQKREPGAGVVEAAALALSMLGDPTRFRLMVALTAGEQDVTTLTTYCGAARPAVSQHLGKLRLSGLVTMRREGRRAIYSIAGEHVARLVTESVFMAEHHVSELPAHHVPHPR